MRVVVRTGLIIAFCLYLLILTKLILFKHLPAGEIINHFTFKFDGIYWPEHHVIPFKTIFYYLFLADMNVSIRIENLVGNIIGFAPFGFMLPLISKKWIYVNLLATKK